MKDTFRRVILPVLLSICLLVTTLVSVTAADPAAGTGSAGQTAAQSGTGNGDQDAPGKGSGNGSGNGTGEGSGSGSGSGSESSSSSSSTEPSSTEPSSTEPSTAPTTRPTTEPTTKPKIKGPTVAYVDGKWQYYNANGDTDPKFTGLAQNAAGWWYVKNGIVDFSETSVIYDPGTKCWWFVKNSHLTKGPDVEPNAAGWWYINEEGLVDFGWNQIAHNAAGWWYIKNGKVDFNFTGVWYNAAGWWYCKGGKVDFNFTGISENAAGQWYVKNGAVNFNYTGNVSYNGMTYHVTGGKVDAARVYVPSTSQLPDFPTGCEAASAAALLRYYGYSVSTGNMVSVIPRQNLYVQNGRTYGPSIYEKFVGDPRGTYTSGTPGYGAFAPVVTRALNTMIAQRGGWNTAVNITGASPATLYNYIAHGSPVLVWATYNMNSPKTVNAWYIKTSNGDQYFSYPRGTHVMILMGYDADSVTVMDPYGGGTKVFSRSAFVSKYNLLGKQAIVIQ